MEQTGGGVISQNDLMTKLAQAKKVMNKVDGGKSKPNHINEERARYSDDYDDSNEFDMNQLQIYDQTQHLTENMNVSRSPYNVDKINQSRLPDSIKKAMIERPISQPDISLSDGIDMKIINGARRLIEQDTPNFKKKPLQEQTRQTQQPQVLTNDLITSLMPIMENMIRKVMDEKLNQILSAQQTQSINENLVLKVGDSIFKGKITGVNKAK